MSTVISRRHSGLASDVNGMDKMQVKGVKKNGWAVVVALNGSLIWYRYNSLWRVVRDRDRTSTSRKDRDSLQTDALCRTLVE